MLSVSYFKSHNVIKMYVDVVWMYITLTAFSNNMVMHHMGGPDSAFLNWVYINKIIFTQKTVKI